MIYLTKYLVTKKNVISIPKNVYLKRINNKLIIKGPLGFQYVELKNKIIINKKNTKLAILPYSFQKSIYINSRINLKAIQSTLKALIKKNILGVLIYFRKQLNFIGVGFRATIVKKTNTLLLQLRLGYSHPIFIKIPYNIQIICPKPTQLFILGNCYNTVLKIASLIKSYRKPEPYKGKGILFKNEIIKRKKGKKI
jgi:large subunit ribosomal protein L6